MVALYVLAFLCVDNTVLLLRRHNVSFADGLYHLVGGKVEQHETALQAIRREVSEEVALDIPESSFELVHTFHRKGTEGPLIALIFKADISKQAYEIRNAEPEKHDDMRFFPVSSLPTNMIPAHQQALECIFSNRSYSQHGW